MVTHPRVLGAAISLVGGWLLLKSRVNRSAGRLARLVGFLRMALCAPLMLAQVGGVVALVNFFTLTVKWWNQRLARDLNCSWSQQLFVQGMSAVFPSSKIVISGELPTDDTQAIVICNHQIDTDWWYVWEMLRCVGRHGDAKFIMKDDFEKIPLVAAGVRGLQFVTLKRDWAKDKDNLEKQLRVFADDDRKLRLVIFPEGVTVNTKSQEKSRQYAKREGRPAMSLVLLPRVTGFEACVDAILKGSEGAVVYDVTVAHSGYSGEIPTWAMGYERKIDTHLPNINKLLMGHTTEPVHMHIVKHSLRAVKSGKGGVQGWIDKAWVEKDRLLAHFIKEGKFTSPSPSSSTTTSPPSAAVGSKAKGEEGAGREEETEGRWVVSLPPGVGSMMFMTTLSLGSLLLMGVAAWGGFVLTRDTVLPLARTEWDKWSSSSSPTWWPGGGEL